MRIRWQSPVEWLLRSTGRPARLTPWGWAADAMLALALAIGAINGATERTDSPRLVIDPGWMAVPGRPPVFMDEPSVSTWQVVLVLLTTVPLVTRRRFPLWSFWVIAIAASSVYGELQEADTVWTLIASLVAAYSATTHSRYRNLALASVLVAALWVVARNRDDLPALPAGLMMFLLLALVGLGANAIHTWRQRAQTLQGEQHAATQLAVDRERARLALELHDVVGHNVAVMVVQAGAARKVMDTDPELAREALRAVESGGRAAMTELRQVIGLLAVETDGPDLAPPPGLDELPRLAARVRETGVAVTLRVTGTFTRLPPGVDLAAYRVVQEALTNAVKHAAGGAVSIDVTGTDDELRMEITDTGGSASTAARPSTAAHPSTAAPGSGRGLAGLRERLAVYGGTLIAGRRPTGGYRLVAAIPLRSSPVNGYP